ncbi:MAG: STAS domain-containing protein [Spirochaetales bacterium]|nr:STAS domain-containing protein [Leptospiraceae bacterium]MCP5482691.1 STAS domain-containing protein [Spirochaetales bacterium]MCP5485073.1 STAS domain-containing protein [Spirochaetales bacterium]
MGFRHLFRIGPRKFQINSRHNQESGATVLDVTGELDSRSALKLEAAVETLLEKDIRKIVIDRSSLERLRSTSLSVLINCARRTRNVGGMLRIVNAIPEVSDLIGHLHFQKILPLFKTAERTRTLKTCVEPGLPGPQCEFRRLPAALIFEPA